MSRSASLFNVGVSLALLAALAGCVVVPASRPYYAGGGYYDGMVAVAPPAPQQEYIGAPPVAGYIWIGGFWNWVGGRHVWVSGRWDAPRPGHYWVPHRWEPVAGQWRLAPGRWERSGR